MTDPKPTDLANEPESLKPELEAVFGALADLQAGRTVNWDQIKREYWAERAVHMSREHS
jgi:hypothetical protein